MAPVFERSEKTRRLIDMFLAMPIGEAVSLDRASSVVGFNVTPANCYSARQIVEKEHKIFIYIDRERGLVRGAGSEMVVSGASFLQSIKRKAIRCGRRMETALSQNLTRDDHLLAFETLSRSNIIATTSSSVRIKSNRSKQDAGDAAPAFDTKAALSKLK